MHRSRASLVLLVVILASLPVLTAGSGIAQDATPGTELGGVTILPPDQIYAGASLGEWNARSWQWAMSVPEAVNPSFAADGSGCEIGQFGPVFFVPGSYAEEPVTIPCVVPEGTAIFVGVGGTECSTVESPPFFGRDEAELRACAAALTDGISDLQATVNGVDVPDLEQYRTQSPVFPLNLLADNFFGVAPGVALSVADGYNFIIAPPPPGKYEIVASVTFPDGGTITGTTQITVVAAEVVEPPATPVASPVS